MFNFQPFISVPAVAPRMSRASKVEQSNLPREGIMPLSFPCRDRETKALIRSKESRRKRSDDKGVVPLRITRGPFISLFIIGLDMRTKANRDSHATQNAQLDRLVELHAPLRA